MEKILQKLKNLKEGQFGEYSFKKYENFNYNSYYFDLLVIFSPLIPYILQIRRFYKTKSSLGFSKFMCLLLFLVNILKIFYWWEVRYKKILLYKSIEIVLIQAILIHLCFLFRQKSPNDARNQLSDIKNINESELTIEKRSKINYIKNYISNYCIKLFKSKYLKCIFDTKLFNFKLFWNWPEERKYYKFMLVIITMFSALFSVFKKNSFFWNIIESLFIFFETITCFPQIVSNYRNKITNNISFLMVLCWFTGDVFRLFYNIIYDSSLKIIFGIFIQIILDFILLIQLVRYSNKIINESDSNKKQVEEINQLMKSIDEINVGKNI